MEANQPCGSFKLRGMQVACRDAIENGATKFLASSGGNAGLVVAYVGYNWNVPTTVVLPDTTPENVIDHPKLWEGHSTIVDDLVWQCPEKPDSIVLSVGGGGMMNGVVEGLVRNGWRNTGI